jgi:hypothetical protein
MVGEVLFLPFRMAAVVGVGGAATEMSQITSGNFVVTAWACSFF